jgi:hypothetical protein
MGQRSVNQQLKRILVDWNNAERVTWQRHEKLELEIRVFGREVS